MSATKIEFEIKGSLPGEPLLVAFLEYLIRNRETMSQENRDEWDRRFLQMHDDFRDFWVRIGVLKEASHAAK